LKKHLALFGLVALLCGCVAAPAPPDPAAARAYARSVAEAEARAAVAVVGARVCRRLTVGIGNTDWVSGVVARVEGDQVAVQIDNAGRMSQVIDGVAVVRGATLRTRPELWTPCR